MKEEVTKDGRKAIVNWVIWDNIEGRVFARFKDKETPDSILAKWYAAQEAAEAKGE
ncbi:hypothetical protein SEA_COMRADE_208 [Streptomyces phage Comrade]|uniref:Uncharacterized protein n=1 Tax=Streptomyces phage Comrade TaxID=2301714 RepID=A0A385DY17_9CAUD|nr:hypothetical protein HWB84_gp070 [Streptomyces phage Comrade]AXQ63445.1 hypothetical protein SEA_COMRADE_208 [Streptomyces phage Comrade]QZE11773.1 hypothetical protein SEA_KARP_207 [Streptomyces phage Karp]